MRARLTLQLHGPATMPSTPWRHRPMFTVRWTTPYEMLPEEQSTYAAIGPGLDDAGPGRGPCKQAWSAKDYMPPMLKLPSMRPSLGRRCSRWLGSRGPYTRHLRTARTPRWVRPGWVLCTQAPALGPWTSLPFRAERIEHPRH
jgi:hypothetical protein